MCPSEEPPFTDLSARERQQVIRGVLDSVELDVVKILHRERALWHDGHAAICEEIRAAIQRQRDTLT
jgi:hypothetical protein